MNDIIIHLSMYSVLGQLFPQFGRRETAGNACVKRKKKKDKFNDISETRDTYHIYDVPQRGETSHKNKQTFKINVTRFAVRF